MTNIYFEVDEKYINKIFYKGLKNELIDKYKDGYNNGYTDALKQKTGRWFLDERPESDRKVVCSNCNQPIFKYHKLDFDYRPKYCPNCGAKMEAEE